MYSFECPHLQLVCFQLQGYRFFPRALLQKMLEDIVDPGSVKWTGLRKLEQRSAGINDYINKAWKKLCLPEDLVMSR